MWCGYHFFITNAAILDIHFTSPAIAILAIPLINLAIPLGTQAGGGKEKCGKEYMTCWQLFKIYLLPTQKVTFPTKMQSSALCSPMILSIACNMGGTPLILWRYVKFIASSQMSRETILLTNEATTWVAQTLPSFFRYSKWSNKSWYFLSSFAIAS